MSKPEEDDKNDSREAANSIKKAGNELFQDIDNIDAIMLSEQKNNAYFKRRLLWLIPFNFTMIWGTMRYSANIQNIGKKWWPK